MVEKPFGHDLESARELADELHESIDESQLYRIDGIGDLDAFKQINDRHGHLTGDACLKAVRAVLAEHARADDQVFRWGGDEFACSSPPPTAALLARKLAPPAATAA